MQNKNYNFIDKLDKATEFFEHLSPSLFSLMATILPYFSPLPIATLTAVNAQSYLGFTPTISGIFVFVLECLGLWVTTVLVDTIVEAIRSRNAKTFLMVAILSLVVLVYIVILINLNVSLENAIKIVNPIYSRIITLICFIPLISGFMNGYHKVQIQHKFETKSNKTHEQEREDMLRHEQQEREDKGRELDRQERLTRAALRKGIVPSQIREQFGLTEEAVTILRHQKQEPVKQKENNVDWRVFGRTLNHEQKLWLAHLDKSDDQDSYANELGVTKKTIQNFRKRCRLELGINDDLTIEEFIKTQNRFPNSKELTKMKMTPIDVANFIMINRNYLETANLVSSEDITNAETFLKSQQ